MTADRARNMATGLLRLLAGATVALAAPMARVHASTDATFDDATWHRSIALAFGVVVALGLSSLIRRPAFASVGILIAAVAAAVTMEAWQGRLAGAWLLGCTLMAAWGVHRIRPLPFVPAPSGSATVPLVVLALGAWRVSGVWDVIPALGLALSAAMVVPVALSIPSRPTAALRRVAWRIGGGVWWVLGWPVAFFGVVVPWGVRRILRWDGYARHSPGGWIDLDPSDSNARRLWQSPVRRPRLDPVAAFRARAVAVASVAVAVGIAFPVVRVVAGAGADRLPDSYVAVEGKAEAMTVVERRIRASSWFDQFQEENATSSERSHLSQYVGMELGDVDGEVLTIRGGRRVSWRPPEPRCGGYVDVWVFGGSSTFGVGARNEHTVPSELARQAADAGIALRVENWAVPADVAWQEHARMVRAFANERRNPDLVVFLDGFNDLALVRNMGDTRGRMGDFVGPLDPLHMAILTTFGPVDDGSHHETDDPSEPASRRSAEESAAIAQRQYVGADDLSRRFLGRRGVPMVRFAQASLWSRRPAVAGEDAVERDSYAADRAFRAGLPSGIVDLGDMFERRDGPIYNDEIHTDERGNRLIAAAMFDHLASQLRALAREAGQDC